VIDSTGAGAPDGDSFQWGLEMLRAFALSIFMLATAPANAVIYNSDINSVPMVPGPGGEYYAGDIGTSACSGACRVQRVSMSSGMPGF
jgi:hypothetical protein